MVFQFIASVVFALVVSPRAWSGEVSHLHPHVWSAVILGGIISIFPCLLVQLYPGMLLTRHVVGVSQMLMGALLIHLTGGRIETHFHVFGSLAFLSFYRDWPVLISASAVVATDHFLRGVYWPQSVFGVLFASQWRWIEHAAWVVFIDVFLVSTCIRSIREMRDSASRMAELEATNRVIDAKVKERTAELARHRERLEEEVAERTSALQAAMSNLKANNVELELANQHKNRFLSTMSHELRTPLNAIIGFTDLLQSEGFGTLNKDQSEYVGRVAASGEHLLSLINDVLDVARIDAGTMEFRAEPFEVKLAVHEVMKMLSEPLKKKSISIKSDIPDNAGAVVADQRKFRQILLNLVGNAIKYSPDGGHIEIGARPDGEHELQISVSDHGIGIAEEDQSRIFDEFHQVNRRRDEALGGIGLGLALTRRLVDLQGGRIWVESELGRGSTFIFTLPRSTEGVAGPESAVPELEQAGGRQTEQKLILIAEDNEANRVMIENMIYLKHYQTVLACNGRECIELAQKHRPDLILTDVRMPVMDGLEATRRLRAMPDFQNIPIIALTANASAVSEEDCLAAGCDEHMAKPVKIRQLFAALDRYLKPESDPIPA